MAQETPAPPRLAAWLVRAFCAREHLEALEGDLHELFARRVARGTRAQASRHYWLEAIGACLRYSRVAAWYRASGQVSGTLEVYPLRIAATILIALALVGVSLRWLLVAKVLLVLILPESLGVLAALYSWLLIGRKRPAAPVRAIASNRE
ncbi:MAG: permease prefix domain 2-containing transporter [Myxococcales bacterium]|nr:permease prefix domain 2-containing transporter [Myxococcales bacterium]